MNKPIASSWIILNEELIPADTARISPLSDGFMYGLGLFETIKVLGGHPVFFQEHFDRMSRGIAELGLVYVASANELRARCLRLIAANQLPDGGLKIVIFQDAGRIGELISTRQAVYQAGHYGCGFRLKTILAGHRNGIISGLKTLNYLGCHFAKQAAVTAGCDEALLVDASGNVMEGSMSNVFVISKGIVFTPSLEQGILPGIVRSKVLRILENHAVRESKISLPFLYKADEVFITNSLLGVTPVAQVDEQSYDVGTNSITKSIIATYRALESRTLANE